MVTIPSGRMLQTAIADLSPAVDVDAFEAALFEEGGKVDEAAVMEWAKKNGGADGWPQRTDNGRHHEILGSMPARRSTNGLGHEDSLDNHYGAGLDILGDPDALLLAVPEGAAGLRGPTCLLYTSPSPRDS